MKVKRVNPPYRRYSLDNPSQFIFRSFQGSEIPGGLEMANPVKQNFTHVNSPRGFTRGELDRMKM